MPEEFGPAAKSGPTTNYDKMLDALVGTRLVMILLAPTGEQIRAIGINRGDHLDGDNGVQYPYTSYKVQSFL